MPEEYVSVTYCGNCPFSVDPGGLTGYCTHPDSDEENELYYENLNEDDKIAPPEWCPLRAKDILISLTVD